MVSTRFSNTTFGENRAFCSKTGIKGCIYGSPFEMSPNILYDSLVFVIDMNNDTNQIEGIGLVRNLPFIDKYYPIYTEGNYNRFVYKSDYHISREILLRHNHILVIVLDYLLFKEKNHMKRGCGFTTITQKIINGKTNPKYKLLDINKISQAIKACFNITMVT
jgi:hypothetical protein